MPKTGTTTIQHSLKNSYAALKRKKVIYPKSALQHDNAVAHHEFFLHYASDRNAIKTPLPQTKLNIDQQLSELTQERQQADAEAIILSSEMLWNPIAFDEQSYKQIQQALKNYRIYIIFYFRPVADHMLSGFAQRVCGPQRYSNGFSQHVQDMIKTGTYEYRPRITMLRKLFGADNVAVAWLPNLRGDVLLPMRQLLPQLECVKKTPDMNQRKGWVYVAATRRINGTQTFIGGRAAHKLRAIAKRLDNVVSSSTLQNSLSPAKQSEIRQIEEKFKDQDRYARSIANC